MTDSEAGRENTQTLRLLDEPIHRWPAGDKAAEGALFAFCETTDPEALLLLDYDEEGGAWTYSLARITSRPLVFRLDEQEILAIPGYWRNPRSSKDPYIERQIGEYTAPEGSSGLME